jgi:octaprenyl-diphosphate synthase
MMEKAQGTDARPRVTMQDLQRPVREELLRVQDELARFFVCDVRLINEISSHMLRANGKRFRPTLLLLANRLHGPVGPEGVLAATIVELIHTATLVHDDSIDRSFLRRGIPTVNSIWNDQTSVIMGDYLYSKAFFLLVERGMMEPMQVLARTTHRMSLGEMLELEHELDFDLSEEVYYRLIMDKTAVLLGAACEIGAYLGWGDGRERRLLADFGLSLGMAFQITDDMLDIEGDAEVMGKNARSDIRDGKITLPLIHALRTAPPAAAQRVRERMAARDLDDAGAAEIARFTADHGGLEYARHRARGYADRALELLDAFEPSTVRDTLHDAVEYILDRRQ